MGFDFTNFTDKIDVDPPRRIRKGALVKFVGMEDVGPKKKKVTNFIIRSYTGGSRFKNEDTLFARITPSLEHCKTAFVDFLKEGEIGAGSTEFIVLSPKDEKTLCEFVYYLSISDFVRDPAIKSMTGTSGRQRVDKNVFSSIKIPNIPIGEQRGVSKVLSDLDSKIDLNLKMSKTLESIAQAIFKHWFIDFEFPDENGKPYKLSGGEMVYNEEFGKEIPKGWSAVSITDLATFLNGLPLQKYPASQGEDYLPVIKIKELNDGISESTDLANMDVPPNYVINDGDILFSWSGSLNVVIWGYGKGALNQHLFNVTSDKYPKWLYYQWLIHYLPNYIAIAKDKATTMGHIQRHHLSKSVVVIPDDVILAYMNKTLEPIMERTVRIKIESRLLSQTRDSLLPRLMSGKIRVPMGS